MIPNRWLFVPTALGFILLTAGAADGHEFLMSARDDDWLLFARLELEFLGGLWLISGLSPRWTRIAAMAAFLGVLTCDLARTVVGYPPRDGFGRAAVGPLWLMCSNIVIIFAVLRWRPATARLPWIDSHPGRVIAMASIAAAMGVAINWSQIGYFPIVATARSGGSPSIPGLDHLAYLPRGYYRSRGRWPLILDLHGSGGVGHDIGRVRAGGLPRRIDAGLRLPFIVVAPQSPRQGWDVGVLDALLDEVLRRFRVDADRVYLTGSSMGGYGAWALAAARPNRFAAIAPICGGGDPDRADRLRGVPTWAFHGAEDRTVPPEESWRMVAALERAGGEVKLTIYPGVGHDAATPTYNDRGLYDWFLNHRRRTAETKLE